MSHDVLCENITKYRELAGLSQSELGRRLNISSQAVSRWERGGMPDVTMLPRIAEVLNCSPNDLYGYMSPSQETVEEILAQDLRCTPPEQRFRRATQLSWHLMKITGSLVDNGVNSFYDVATSCEDSDLNTDTSNAPLTDCSLILYNGLMQASVASGFKYVLMMQEPENGFGEVMRNVSDYQRFFRLFCKDHRLAVFLLGYTLPSGQLFTRDYICEQLGISDETAQEILAEMCDYRMFNFVSIRGAGQNTEAYTVHSCPAVVPMLYFLRMVMPEGRSYYLNARQRDEPLLSTSFVVGNDRPAWDPISSKDLPTRSAYAIRTEKSQNAEDIL